MSRAIVNVSIGGYHGTPGNYYPVAQARLLRTLADAGQYNRHLVFWKDEIPPGCESHALVPYLFKQAAMREAANRGHRTLLWLDAPMMALAPVETLFRQIEERGYFLWSHPPGEWTVGAWTSDLCLKAYGVGRGEAFSIEMLCSGVFGYSLDHPTGRRLHDEFQAAPAIAFRGTWHNRNNAVAQDRRVNGHRHDQSVLSILAHKLGLGLTADVASLYGHEKDCTVLLHDPDGKRGWE